MLGEAKTTTIPLRKFISKLNTFVVFGVIACGVGLMSSPASDQALIGLPELEVGAIASQDLRSPIDITVRDTELESRLRHEAMSSVMPVLDFMAQPSIVLKKRINSRSVQLVSLFKFRITAKITPSTMDLNVAILSY